MISIHQAATTVRREIGEKMKDSVYRWANLTAFKTPALNGDDPEQTKALTEHIDELVAMSAHHPSVIMWGILNESHSMVEGCRPAYETLLDRARREAVLRMKAQAEAMGAMREQMAAQMESMRAQLQNMPEAQRQMIEQRTSFGGTIGKMVAGAIEVAEKWLNQKTRSFFSRSSLLR